MSNVNYLDDMSVVVAVEAWHLEIARRLLCLIITLCIVPLSDAFARA